MTIIPEVKIHERLPVGYSSVAPAEQIFWRLALISIIRISSLPFQGGLQKNPHLLDTVRKIYTFDFNSGIDLDLISY